MDVIGSVTRRSSDTLSECYSSNPTDEVESFALTSNLAPNKTASTPSIKVTLKWRLEFCGEPGAGVTRRGAWCFSR